MIVIKASPNKNNGGKTTTIICKDGNTTYTLTGYLPEIIPNGLWINVEYDVTDFKGKKGFIQKYTIPTSDRNIGLLKKNGVDNVEEYIKTCDIQNKTHLKWDKCVSFNAKTLYDTMSFEEADKIHKEVINDAEDIARLKAINSRILKLSREKRKEKMTVNEYFEYFEQVEAMGCYACMKCSKRIECLKDNRLIIQGGRIVDEEILSARETVNGFLNRPVFPLMSEKEVEECKEFYKGNLSDEQISCIDLLKNNMVSTITGGAGTGKTTVIKAIEESYGRYYGTNHICMIAPTGKASQRIEQQTGFNACSTIHACLRKSEDFIYYNEHNKLPYNLIIVDESSMIDILLMRDLLNAIDNYTKVIFVGDHNQLPPVDIGEPYFDFLEDKTRVTSKRLTKNFRQGENNGILINADILLDKESKISDLKEFDNFIIRDIKKSDIFDKYISRNTLCITPFNELNTEINEMLKNGKNAFNVDDKVIFLRNTKEYCNGDTGVVTGFDGASVIVKTDFGKTIIVKGKNIDDLALAFALTIHKTQGSEYDDVKIFIPKGNPFVTRRMLYTAITRAKHRIGLYIYEEDELKEGA